MEEIKTNQIDFMNQLQKPLGRNALDQLKQMQNDEIGNYEHFHLNMPQVLSLDLYLKLEKRRKQSRDVNPSNPDGRFDFDQVTSEELRQDNIDRDKLSEYQHIHNKVLFDCINDSL